MPFEYLMLTIMTFFFMVAWFPWSVAKGQTFGFKWLISNREAVPGQLPAWGARAERAYNNLKDFFPAFAVAILVLGQLNKFDHTTSLAAAIYVLGRVVHYTSYVSGIFAPRFLSWVVAMACNAYLLIKILL